MKTNYATAGPTVGNIFLVLPLLLLLTCCTFLGKKMYGIKDPDIENRKTITEKALKFELDTTNIVATSIDHVMPALKGGVPEGAIFDSNGEYIEYRVTDTSCNAGLFQFIPDLALGKVYNKTGKTDLKTELSKFRDLSGGPLPAPAPADFYVLIYWTVWTGKLNKDHVKIWEDLAKNNKNCRVHVIKVNLDVQENWEASKRDELVKSLRKGI
jgi:hypothetical protein